MNNSKLTYDKFKTGKFGFSILDMLYSCLLKLFTYLIDTAANRFTNIYQ